MSDEELPEPPESEAELAAIFGGLSYRTRDEVEADARRRARLKRRASLIFVAGAVVIPVTIAVLGVASVFVGVLAMVYSVCVSVYKGLRMLGKIPKSAVQKAREEDQRLAAHHHYHCQQNPEGFLRLKLENFERESRDRIAAEHAALRAGSPREDE
jgi:hypothetical protein